MSFWYIVIPMVVLFMLLVWFAAIRIETIVEQGDEGERIDVFISMWFRWLRFRITIPTIDWQGLNKGIELEWKAAGREEKTEINIATIEQIRAKFDQIMDRVRNLLSMISAFLDRVYCERFQLHTLIGTGDAAETGIIVGLVWMIQSNIVGFFHPFIKWETTPQFGVTPHFSQAVFALSFHSLIRFRLGNLLIIMIKAWWQYRRSLSMQANNHYIEL